ncbi:unnamed protein product, partial [Medioppia subpectinata]
TTEYNHLIDVYSLELIGAKIFGFDSDDIRDGVFEFDFNSIINFNLRLKLVQMYTLLVSMSVSIYTENCEEIKDIWKQRPECEILVKLSYRGIIFGQIANLINSGTKMCRIDTSCIINGQNRQMIRDGRVLPNFQITRLLLIALTKGDSHNDWSIT